MSFTRTSINLTGNRTLILALSLLFPRSSFARTYETGDFKAVQGKIFTEPGQPILSATYLPSGNGRFWRKFWEAYIPTFVHHARTLVS